MTGPKAGIAKLPMTTSRAKNAPEMGALKAAAISPAAPQPANVGKRFGGNAQQLTNSRAERCADMNNRSLTSDRSTGSDSEG